MNISEKYDLFIFDLDGVIYTGNKLVPGGEIIIKELQDQNKIIYFLTNNSTKTREDFKEKLKKLKIHINIKYIITSAFATSFYLYDNYKNMKYSYVIGQNGIIKELENLGFKVLKTFNENINLNFVIVGLDQFFNYEKLTIAHHYLIKGAEFIATNNDPSLPTEGLSLPGAGSIVKALETCSGMSPLITIGKPNPFMVNLILEREKISKNRALLVGDRLTTDILAGINSNIDTLLVKTGAGEEELNNKELNSIRPNYIINSIADLLK